MRLIMDTSLTQNRLRGLRVRRSKIIHTQKISLSMMNIGIVLSVQKVRYLQERVRMNGIIRFSMPIMVQIAETVRIDWRVLEKAGEHG